MPGYETLYPVYEAMLLEDMDKALTECDLWDWLRAFEPNKAEGFMFTKHPNLERIREKMRFANEHTPTSFAWCLRNIQSITRNGWESYKNQILAIRAAVRIVT